MENRNTKFREYFEETKNETVNVKRVECELGFSQTPHDISMVSENYVLWLEEKLQNAKLEIKIQEEEISIRNGKIDELKSTYIGQTDSLHCSDGELYIEYDEDKTLVMDVEQLYKDLPFIISQVVKEQKKTHKMHLKMLQESLNDIK